MYNCGGGDCHCGARGGHRHLLPQGPAPREVVQTEEEQASLLGVRGGYWRQDSSPLVS